MTDVYLYGMTVVSSIHRCGGALPLGSGYAEVVESYVCPGGEAMNAAMLLSGLGLSTALAGPHWGTMTSLVLESYARRYGIDVGGVTRDAEFAGVRDLVVVAGAERTVLGWFGEYFSDPKKRWDAPCRAGIESAHVVAIDPYFQDASEQAARFSREAGKPYVTIDCPFDGELHARSAANVISREYRRRHYPGVSDDALFRAYAERGGLTVFTAGNQSISFGRPGRTRQQFEPHQVPVKSTLGAGDAFRAGVVFGVRNGFEDRECIEFAAALAGLMCTRLPIADNVPSRGEVEALLRTAAVR